MAPRARKVRFRRFAWRSALGLAVIAIGAFCLYAYYLDRTVTQQFQGRRWTLPAQVYAAPLELYVGAPLPMSELVAELARLQYRAAPKLDRPGTYHRQDDRIDVALRATRFADEVRAAQVLTIVAGAHSIEALRDAAGQDIPILRLDPLLIGSIFPTHGEDRIVVTPAEVPVLLPEALKAVEDRKFDSHHGVDPEAVVRAMWVDLRSHQIAQGGSTLTQQLVKSYFLNSRQTMGRKVREALMAFALEAHFTKSDLMNAYINEIYLGQDGDRAVHGFGLASQFYFGKPLAEVDLSELSLLVALVRGPSFYDPRHHPERALARRNLVLKLMADLKVITPQDAANAASRPLGVTSRAAGAYYPSYLDFVRRTLRRDYPESDLTQEGLKIYTSLEPRAQDDAEQTLDRELARLEKSRAATSASLDGAVVITSPVSGDVIAIVGGRRIGYSGFNRALDAARPMGSVVKPFVYLTALETHRYNPASIVQDAPVDIRMSNGTHWRPLNFTRRTYGPVPLVCALAESLNQATVAVGMDIGVTHVAQTLQRFGLERAPAQVPALLLGAVNATPLEVAQLYTGLANGGYRMPLRAVRTVLSASGQPLKAFPLELTPIAQPDVVFEVDQMMQQVIERGTGRAARTILPRDVVVVGKSGTTQDLRDSWFAGFSGSHLAVVWVGYDDNRPTGFTGSAAALAIWSRVLASLGTTSWSAAMPDPLTEVAIDYWSGLQIEGTCANADTLRIGSAGEHAACEEAGLHRGGRAEPLRALGRACARYHPSMMIRIALLFLFASLAACRSLLSPERPPQPAPEPASSATPAGAAPPAVSTPPTPTRQYRLGSAATALVAQAHSRAAAGDYPAATATLERALRIEPENPLAWIELGRVQLASGNSAQADHMGHKALGLASGDPNAQAAAWRLIADSLRVRGRNEEASSATAHADLLVPH